MGASNPGYEGSPRAQVDAKAARCEPVFHAFGIGDQVYLSVKYGDSDTSVPTNCVSIQPEGHIAVVQWSEAGSGLPLEAGLDVTCQILREGVLYLVRAQIDEVTPGKHPRIKLRVAESCVALPLRHHQRYQVQGRLRLGAAGNEDAYLQKTYHSMDVSLGGFGLTLPHGAWPGDGETPFALSLLVERDGAPVSSLPGLEIEGRAAVRKRRESEDGTTVYLGLEFVELAESQAGALHFWLIAHQTYLRGS